MSEEMEANSLENRPGILMIGSSNVGKRSLLSRLLSVEFDDNASDSPSELLSRGWSIDTKYYTADVSVWMSHLHDQFSITSLPFYHNITALVLVFDVNDLSSFVALRDWVSHTDIHKFEILLCIGNKVDLISGHPVHAEYRRRLLKFEDYSSSDTHTELTEFGISKTEGCSLLGGEEESAWDNKNSFIEWCTEHNIEYIEACASNPEFDKCLSADGDSQGIERLFGALSAHMWPGMILKSGDSITRPTLPNKEDLSEEESDYELEYEVLSAGSAEPWDDTNVKWVSAVGASSFSELTGSVEHINNKDHDNKAWVTFDEEPQPSTSMVELSKDKEVPTNLENPSKGTEINEVTPFEFEDLDQLMSEIGNVRENLRFMPDFQRREMAAKVAMKMAAMFGGGSDDDEELS